MKRRSREFSSLDITPMVDVVFLLLIFFMVSTVFRKDEMALLLELPKASSGESSKSAKKILLVELSENEIAYNGTKILMNEFQEKIKGIADKNKPVELRVDKSVRYEKLVEILDILKKYSLTNLSLITNR